MLRRLFGKIYEKIKESKALKAALTGEEIEEDVYQVQETAPVIASEPEQTTQNNISYPKGSYFVQVGSFSVESGAQNIASQLDVKSNIFYTNVNGQNYYRVRVGPFADEQSANEMLANIKNKGIYDAKVVSD